MEKRVPDPSAPAAHCEPLACSRSYEEDCAEPEPAEARESSGAAPRKSARGSEWNPKNRFEKLEYVPDPPDAYETGESGEDAPPVRTQFFRDDSQSIISRNQSPDVGFEASLNPYRGCEHGCAYCFARPTHEYLGWSAGLDFESRIVVKENAAKLLREALSSKRWKPEPLIMSGVTDCYQPVERKLQITRACLAVLAEFRNPVAIITKNHLVTRDIDYLGELARHGASMVNVSITTLDPELAKILEPRASPPSRRLAAVEELTQAGIPVRVLIAPVIPGLNDHEIPALVVAAAKAGARGVGYIPIRLPGAVKPVFERWLDQHFPRSKAKVLDRIRDLRGGKLNEPNFGSRMRGQGIYADTMRKMFAVARRKAGLEGDVPPLSTAAFRAPGEQMTLF